MEDDFHIPLLRSIQAESGTWYKCLQRLGTGGNAVTFLVLATSGHHQGVLFAAKVFRRISKPDRRDSFLREIDFLRQTSHASIMRVYDRGLYYDQHPFLIAEYLPVTLATVIRSGAATTVEKLSYALQLLSALACLESFTPAVIHRDIKPQNVFVKGRSCVLGDFGLLKHLESDAASDRDQLKQSVGMGMPWNYRTPDLVAYLRNESDVTTKSDVFQLGLVLAELFTGRNPHRSYNTDGSRKQFEDAVELEPLKLIRGALGPMIAQQVDLMLHFDVTRRPAASQLLSPWQRMFEAAALRVNALEGRVF